MVTSFSIKEHFIRGNRWDCSLQDKLLDHTSVTHLFPVTKYLGLLATVISQFSTMGKKKSEDAGPSTKAKPGSKDVSKKEKFSVSAMLAGMDEKADKPKKASSNKAKPKPAPKASAYTDDIDLPPSDDDESEEEQEEKHRPDLKPLEVSIAEKELKKREKKDILAAHVAEQAKKEALRDDRDAFTVVIGSRASVLDGDDGADANVKDITIENFSVAARGKELLKNTSVKISHGKRYGLIGPNGMGKSTLLKLLAWRKIPVPKNIDVLLVEQEVVGDDKTALEAVVSANVELIKVRQKVADLQNIASGEEGMDKDDTNEEEDAGEKLAELYEQLQLMGSDAAESQASKILAGLGFTKDMQGRPTKSFSGGWRMRISLARALFVQPTLLLLDEPTNHLDLRAVLWLEEYLCRWKKTLVVVSHDRDFLNTVCSEIIHLHDLKLHFYRGNFDAFESGYEQRRREANKKYEIFDKQLKAARRTGNKAQQDKVKDRAKFAAAKESKSKSKGKVDEDETQVEVPHKWRDYSVEFHFPEPTELTPPLLQLIEVSFSYPNREDFRLSDVDVGIDMGTRVAIVGPNGAGKSTLLNLLAGDLVPSEGEVRRSQKLRIGRYSQHFVDLLTMDETPVQYLLRLHPDQEGLSKQEAVRAKLGKYGLPSHNHLTPIVKLSGGQKARVVFTSISMSRPHILLLDEPTNHLDMQSIDALADALDEFTGGVVLVSHDSRLISRVCDDEERSQIWVVEDGTVRNFPGTFEDYKEDLLKEIKAEVDD
ncbi:ABC transporter family F protein PpABCF protein [Medicago truncatula]|uniref:ABC transporter family F protein PpABCF protein n=2 Tax=Medicago truncatula TaxID=3880 RepID=G7LB54_MEDTR|nr:ABC transporter family F protein PpABCF protein [Medicago truncatula]